MTAGSAGRSSCYCTTLAGICIWPMRSRTCQRDVRAGAYNPLRYRYGADGGTLDPADRAQLLETIDASISMACSAMELLDGRRDRELLSNILYFGLPAVLHAVAEGTFRKAGNRRKT